MQKQNGFSAVEILLVVGLVAIVGFAGWFVWHTSRVTNGLNSATQKESQSIAVSSVHDFYSCWDKVKQLNDKNPDICTYQGTTYHAPTKFDKSLIKYLNKVPMAAQPMVTAFTQKIFNECLSGTFPPYQPTVSLVQSNFVDISLGCDSGFHEYFAMDNGTWRDTGGGQMGIGCETVNKYNIRASSLTDATARSTYSTCYYANGKSGTIPK